MTQKQLIEEYTSLPAEAQRQVEDFIAFLQVRYKVAQAAPTSSSHNLEDEPFIGMWRNREDLADSSTWVRNNRKAEWGESL